MGKPTHRLRPRLLPYVCRGGADRPWPKAGQLKLDREDQQQPEGV